MKKICKYCKKEFETIKRLDKKYIEYIETK